jgi:hypothetical protein
MPTITIEKPITLVRGLFQVRKEAENCWACSAVIYGSDARFVQVELERTEIEALLAHFNIKVDLEADSFICEFISDCPLDKLAEFGIKRIV